MNSPVLQLIGNILVLIAFVASVLFFLYRWLKGSREPAALLFRWVLTAAAIGALWYGGSSAREDLEKGNWTALFAVAYALTGGLFLAFVWVPVMVAAVARPFSSLYDGGDAEVEAKPYYSIFQAKRGKGQYFEALAEVRRQLDKFPADFEGQMLMAALQAENLNDLPGAEVTIQRLCAQPGHLMVNVVDALNRLADWHLHLTHDRDSAKKALEQIIAMFPGSEHALIAAQRIGRIANAESVLGTEQRTEYHVTKGVENLGLTAEQAHLKRAEADPTQEAADYVKHLAEHPQDTHAREKLALIYAQHYQRLDLALDQLEQLVGQPNQPSKQVIHWLNLMADLQVHGNAPAEQVRDTLQRIIDLYPDLAAAETARRRMDTLKLEFRRQETGHKVRLGTYEQNIGLKGTSLPPGERPSYTPIK